jgi:uncharacterized membrane protein YagU involved in acid resistance
MRASSSFLAGACPNVSAFAFSRCDDLVVSLNAQPLKAVLWGGLLAGTFDITQAFLAWGLTMGVPPIRILQSVASGALGKASFQMVGRSALLGLSFHFLIAFTAAAVYWIVARLIPWTMQHPVWSGSLYGELVYLFMNFVVVPLSAIHRFPTFTLAHTLTGPIGHPLLVGLPIAMIAHRYSGRRTTDTM